MSELMTFMLTLATDPSQQLAFAAAPDRVLAATPLSPELRALVRQQEAAPLRALYPEVQPFLASCAIDPSTDPMPDPDPGPVEDRLPRN